MWVCVCPCVAPVEKLFRLVIIKEVKGSQVAAQLQSSVRDKLSYADKYEDEEEEALDNLVEYFQKKAWLSQDTNIYLHSSNDLKSLQVHIFMYSEFISSFLCFANALGQCFVSSTSMCYLSKCAMNLSPISPIYMKCYS